MIAYLQLLDDILANGVQKTDRTGTGTISLFGRMLRFDMVDGFPALTTKKLYMKGVIHELLWFVSGSTNIQPLVKNGVRIWTAWPLKHYNQSNPDATMTQEEFENRIVSDYTFALRWGELGPVYGKQWRKWNGKVQVYESESTSHTTFPKDLQVISEDRAWGDVTGFTYIDQLQNAIDLLKTTPDSRRIIVNAWNPADIEEMSKSGLPPCHYAYQFCTRPLSQEEREAIFTRSWFHMGGVIMPKSLDAAGIPRYKLDILVNMRSTDVYLGAPFNVASYALLLHMVAKLTGMVPGELVLVMADCHLYRNHGDQAREQLTRKPYPLPTLQIHGDQKTIDDFKFEDFELVNYQSWPAISAPIAV